MRKILSIMAFVLLFGVSTVFLGSCVKDDPVDDKNKVTVSWYYGSKLLKEEKVEKGSKLAEWTPTEDGKTFTGWFSEASASTPFDFAKEINEDTDIFAAFKSDEYVEDVNTYYLVGNGAGDMKKSNWNEAGIDDLTLERQDVAGANVYKITIKMYAGDQFQVCYGGTWDGQQGIGIIPGAEYVAGLNIKDKTEYTADQKKVAAVKDADGNVIFEGYDEYNKEFTVWNIVLAEGQDGVYEFTLTTYPNAKAYNTLEYKLVEKLAPLTVTHEMTIIGAYNGWSESEGLIALSESEDKSCWVGYITVTTDMYVNYGQEDLNTTALKVFNKVDGQYYGYGQDNIFLGEGTWAIKYTVADNSVVVEKLEYYIVGTLVDENGEAVNYAVKEGVSPKLVANEDGTYSIDFTAYDVTGLGGYAWMTDQGKTDANGLPAIISIKVVFGSSLGIKDWYSAAGGDNWYLSAGTYTVTLNPASTEEVKVTVVAK